MPRDENYDYTVPRRSDGTRQTFRTAQPWAFGKAIQNSVHRRRWHPWHPPLHDLGPKSRSDSWTENPSESTSTWSSGLRLAGSLLLD